MPIKKDISMAKLMERFPEAFTTLHRGQVLKGKVISLEERAILVDLGAKSEGVLPYPEVDEASSLLPEQEILVYVLTTEDRRGQVLVSAKKAKIIYAWKILQESLKEGTVIDAVITGFNKGGMVVNILGLQGFLPFSQLLSAPDANLPGPELQSLLDKKRGSEIKVSVLELDIAQNRIVISEKAALAARRKEKETAVLEQIKEGQILSVVVKKVLPFGLMVSYQGVDALIPKAELAWDKEAAKLSDFETGQELEAKVLKVPETLEGRAKLSIRALSEDPWVALAKDKQDNRPVMGKIVKMTSAGVVVMLPQGLEWSVPLSEISQSEDLSAGDELKLRIKSLDAQNRRLELGLAG